MMARNALSSAPTEQVSHAALIVSTLATQSAGYARAQLSKRSSDAA